MISELFNSVYASSTTQVNVGAFFVALATAIALGLISAKAYQYRNTYTKSFVVTLALLPAVVAAVIYLVNGNLGAGVAVAGAFSLVRFRSAPGGAKEIYAIFLAMAIGLATGMGYVGFAICFTLAMLAVGFLYTHFDLGKMPQSLRQVTITIPESLDYDTVFDDVFAEQAQYAELVSVRSSDMGSLFRLKYVVQLKETASEKAFLDALRVRNGNLEITLTRNFTKDNEL